MSIFNEYFSDQPFFDRYSSDSTNAIDVIIPVYHTNQLWRINLISIYREVPVRRLLISDGGVVDKSIDIVKEFPRVEVFNHREYKTLGKCIAELIKEVKSEWFAYLHSDVYLPKNWFNCMIAHKTEFDWYGCPMQLTVLLNYRQEGKHRPYNGSQIGRKSAFEKNISRIDDDFVYRQEDFVFDKIVEDAGFKTGKIEDTFHYHQMMFRESKGFNYDVKELKVKFAENEWEKKRANETQIKGIVKYLDPVDPYVISDFKFNVIEMLMNRDLDFYGFREWIKVTNPLWLRHFNKSLLFKIILDRNISRVRKQLITLRNLLKNKNGQ
jgi:hypothetical protein